MAEITPMPSGGARRRSILGGWVEPIVLVVVAVAIWVLLHPWAFHLGGDFTPLTVWQGVGVVRLPDGSREALQLRLWLSAGGDSATRDPHAKDNLAGMAWLMSSRGELTRYRAGGRLSDAWWSAEGRPLAVWLRSPAGTAPARRMDFEGSWRGRELVLRSHGAPAPGQGPPVPTAAADSSDAAAWRVTLRVGSGQDFEQLGRTLAVRGRESRHG